MKHVQNGYRDANNINNISISLKDEKDIGLTNVNDRRKSQSNSNRVKKEEVEFPNIRTFQKELWQKIYSKESGEILEILRKSNDQIRSNKVTVYDNAFSKSNYNNNINVINSGNMGSEKKPFHEKNTSESQKIENSDYDLMNLNFLPANNNNFDKNVKSPNNNLYVNNTKSNDEKTIEEEFNKNFNDQQSKSNNGNNEQDNNQMQMFMFQPEMVSFKVKSKKKSLDMQIPNEILGKSRESFSKRSKLSNTNLIDLNKNLTNKKNPPNFNNFSKNDNQLEEKSVYLTQSSKNGLPQIFKNNSVSEKKFNYENALNNSNMIGNTFQIIGNSNEYKLGYNLSSKITNLNNTNYKNTNYISSINQVGNCSPNMIPFSLSQNLYNNINNNNNSNILASNSNLNSCNNIDKNFNYGYMNSTNNSNTLNSINKALYKKANKFFCPHCEHCNVIRDENLEKYFDMKEARNIVRKSLDFIVTNYQTDQSYLDFLLGNNNPGLNHLSYMTNLSSLQQINTNNNLNINNAEYENLKNIKNRTKFDIDVLLNTYPKHSNNRTVLQLVTHFLDALINDKVSLDSIAGSEIFERLKDSLISQGVAFKENEGEIEFDKELDNIFDDPTKEKLRKLFKSNIFIYSIS